MSAKKKKGVTAALEFTPNRHIFLTSIVLMILTIGLVVYDYTIGESIFDGGEVSVLSEHATPTPTVTPSIQR